MHTYNISKLLICEAELLKIIDSSKPDIILGNESWLNPDIANSEIFPEDYDAIRKDREDGHGGSSLLISGIFYVLLLQS